MRRVPEHVGIIPDGNRRWAVTHGLGKEGGYGFGVGPGVELFEKCRAAGIGEISIYGFTRDNVRRPSSQCAAFTQACVAVAEAIHERGAALLVVGDHESGLFPESLRPFLTRRGTGVKVNLLVNYGWDWDLQGIRREGQLRSSSVSRLDLVVRWGGGRRLSGFLPIQSVYADFFVVDDLWPDYRQAHMDAALDWFARQDRTLGG